MNRSPSLLAVLDAARARLPVWILIIAAAGLGQACAAREHFMRGTVTVVDPTRIEIKHKTGQLISVALIPGTTYRWDDSPASLNDVGVGARVLIVLDQPPGPFSAAEVRIFTRPHTKLRAPRSESNGLTGWRASWAHPPE